MFSIVCRLLCDPVARMEAIKGTLTRIQRLVMRIAKSASQSSTILTIAARSWRHPIYCEVMRLPSGRVGALSRALWWEGEPSSSSSANMGLGIGGVEKCSFLPTKKKYLFLQKSTYFYKKVLIFAKSSMYSREPSSSSSANMGLGIGTSPLRRRGALHSAEGKQNQGHTFPFFNTLAPHHHHHHRYRRQRKNFLSRRPTSIFYDVWTECGSQSHVLSLIPKKNGILKKVLTLTRSKAYYASGCVTVTNLANFKRHKTLRKRIHLMKLRKSSVGTEKVICEAVGEEIHLSRPLLGGKKHKQGDNTFILIIISIHLL